MKRKEIMETDNSKKHSQKNFELLYHAKDLKL